MATTKFDPFRKQGGTIELVRDAKTGAYSTKTVGFADLPVINLPQLGVVEVADDAEETKKEADKALQEQTSSAFKTGGDDRDKDLDLTNLRTSTFDQQDEAKRFSDAITKTAIENQEAQEEAAGIGIQEIKTPEVFMGEFAGEGPDRGDEEKDVTDVGVPNYEDAILRGQVGVKFVEKDKFGDSLFKFEPKGIETARGRQPTEFTDAATRAAMTTDAAMRGTPTSTFGTGTATDTQAQQEAAALGIQKDPTTFGTGTATDTQAQQEAAALGIQRTSTAFARPKAGTIDQMAANAQVKEEIKKKASAGFPSGIKIAADIIGGVLKAVTGEPSPMDKFKTGRFQTRGDLGSSTDPGRIIDRDSDGNRTVFDGFNRNSAFGNLGNSAQKRTDKVAGYAAKNRNKATELRRSAAGLPPGRKKDAALAKAAKYEAKAKRQQEKADRYQKEVNQYKKEKPVTGTTAPGQKGGADNSRDSGKSIVCTAMYQTTGLQDWAKAMKIWYIYQKKYLTLQHQEGYHKLFKPFVKAMHKSNIIKAIGAHFAKHRTQHLKHVMFNSKPSLLGKIYNKILEPICYWAGRK